MNPDDVYGGKEPVTPLQYKKLEIERLRDIEFNKRLEHTHRRPFDTFWQLLRTQYKDLVSEAIPLTAEEAHRKYEELRSKLPELKPLEDRYLEDLKKAQRYKEAWEKLEKQRLPKLIQQKHDGHDHLEEKPRYMDHDKRYLELLEANPLILKIRQERPDLKDIPTLAKREEDGSLYLNPQLEEHFSELGIEEDGFTIEEAVRAHFREQFAEAAAIYDENEKRRIYNDPASDPAIERLKRDIRKRTEDEIKKQEESKTPEQENLSNETLTLQKEATQKNITQEAYKTFARSYPQKAAAYASREEADPILVQAWLSVKTEQEQQPTKTSYTEIIRRNLEQARPILTQSTQEQPVPRIPKSDLRRPMPLGAAPTNLQRNTPTTSAQGNGAPLRRSPSSPPSGIERGLIPSFPGGQFASKAFMLMPPQVKIGLLIIFIILILLLLLMGGDFDNPNQNDEEFTPVYITKESDKEKIGNPDTNETVTYSIRTTYEGLASDIIVTDPIPEGVEYVSSDPKGKLFDKNGKETSNPKNVTKIVWSLRDIQYGTASESATPTGTQNNVPSVRFDADFYASEGFPTPQEPNPIELDPRALDIWKNDVAQYAVQAGEILGVDPGLIGHWSFLEGINYNISFNNCNDTGDRYNPNQPCSVNNWQLGHGVRPAETVKYLREAFEEMYGDASPETIQRVGQGVLNKMKERYPDKAITKPTSTFPRLTIDELENGMGQEDTRMWVGHLMRDDALYAYLIAKILKYHVDETQPLAEVMLGWGPDDHYAPQRVINFIKAVYDAGLSGGSNSSRKRFTDQTVKLTVKPKRDTKDTYIVNQATAEVINGGKGSSSNKSPVSGNLNNILEAAQSINDALEPGTAYEGTWYNRMITEITNNGYTATIRRGETDAYENSEQLTEAGIYWCTFTVIDSYSLAGYKGMTPENHLAVMNMIPYFKQNHIYLDYDRKNHKEILLQVKPGYAFFIMAHSDDGEHTGQEHTGMVKDIRIDANGNGYIETLESNSTAKSHKFIIENWELLPEGMAYPMRGFGGI